eukprot:COSAG02_NODE_1011_length_15224_cov_12.066909_7_plen_83_part_00
MVTVIAGSCQSITAHMFLAIANAQEVGQGKRVTCHTYLMDRVARDVAATPTAAANTTTREGTTTATITVEVGMSCQLANGSG